MTEITGYADLGKLLRDRRESLGMSRQELAEKADSRYDVIRLYEHGERVMKLDKLFKILNALEISLSEDFVLKTTDGVVIHPQAYRAAARLSALNPESRDRLMGRIRAMLTRAEENEGWRKK